MGKPFDESWFHAPLAGAGDAAQLSPEEAHHLRHVLRVRPGNPITVTNGKGKVFLCETGDRGDSVVAKAREVLVDQPAPPRLHIAMGLLKGKDSEEPVEGLCQLDIASIRLLTTAHTLDFKGQNHTRLMERLEQKSLVALKQAKKAWLTAILPPLPFRDWQEGVDGSIILLHPGEDRLEALRPGPIHLLTGPEGGFSEAELEVILGLPGAGRLGLGPTRIRATHAPLLACGKLMGLGFLSPPRGT